MGKLRYNHPPAGSCHVALAPGKRPGPAAQGHTESVEDSGPEPRVPASQPKSSHEDPYRCYKGESRGGVGWQAVGGLSENLAGVWGPRRSLVDPKLLALMERGAGSGESEGEDGRAEGAGPEA